MKWYAQKVAMKFAKKRIYKITVNTVKKRFSENSYKNYRGKKLTKEVKYESFGEIDVFLSTFL